MDIGAATISRWERGAVPSPSLYYGKKLEKEFGMSKEKLGFVDTLPEVARPL